MRHPLSIFFCVILNLVYQSLFAQNEKEDSVYLHYFSRSDIVTLNFQNLADVIKYVPMFNSQFKNNQVNILNGTAINGNIGIYLDDVFLFQDEPKSMQLEMIAVNHLERIVIKKGSANDYVKRNSPIAIFLYSRSIDKDAGTFRSFISSSANNDIQTGGLYTLSNYKHSFQVHAIRNFRNGYRFNTEQRAHDWAPHRNIDFVTKYRFRIIESSWLETSLSHRNFKQQFKNEIIPNSERVIDQQLEQQMTQFNLALITPLSKNHTLNVYYQNQFSVFNNQFISKNLYHQNQFILPLSSAFDSTRLRQFRSGLHLQSHNDELKLSSELFAEYSQIQEMNFPRLLKIHTGYNDIVVGLSATYKAITKTQIVAGLSHLRNDQLGWFFLPNFEIQYLADENLTLSASWRDAVDYPSIFMGETECCTHTSFLNYARSFSAGRSRLLDFSFLFQEKNFSVNSGMMFYNRTNFPIPDFESNFSMLIAEGASNSLHTYISPKLNWKNLAIQSTMLINGVSPFRSSFNQLFFYTESNWQLSYLITKSQTYFLLNYRRIGNRTFMELEQNDFIFLRSEPIRLLTTGITQSFFEKKLHLTIGVENITNYTAIDLDGFIVGEPEVFQPKGYQIFNRGRNFFIKLTAGEL